MKTILLVDDDHDVLSFLEDSLVSFGYNVISKSDPGPALSVIREGTQVDLVLTDYTMPGMNGHDFFNQIRRYSPSVPVIILTGYDTVETYLKSLSLGLTDCLSKPIRSKDLYRVVKAALERPHSFS